MNLNVALILVSSSTELFDYYTVRMESGSEGDSASHSELGRCGGGGADDSSEVDWEAWETQSDSAPEPAREDEAPFERCVQFEMVLGVFFCCEVFFLH